MSYEPPRVPYGGEPFREEGGCKVDPRDLDHVPGIPHVEVARACPKRELGRGWWPLLDEAFDAVAAASPPARVVWVKQKMGALRIHVRERDEVPLADRPPMPQTPEEWAAFFAASEAFVHPLASLHAQLADIEARSMQVCESCGAPGEVGWGPSLRALCGTCGPAWQSSFGVRIGQFFSRQRGEGPDIAAKP